MESHSIQCPKFSSARHRKCTRLFLSHHSENCLPGILEREPRNGHCYIEGFMSFWLYDYFFVLWICHNIKPLWLTFHTEHRMFTRCVGKFSDMHFLNFITYPYTQNQLRYTSDSFHSKNARTFHMNQCLRMAFLVGLNASQVITLSSQHCSKSILRRTHTCKNHQGKPRRSPQTTQIRSA